MSFETLGLVFCITAAFLLFVLRSWRWNLVALGLVYVGGFLLLYDFWPLEQVAIKLVGGWMAVAVLGATAQASSMRAAELDAGWFFRVLMMTLLLLVAWSTAPQAQSLVPGIDVDTAFAGLLLASAGMLRSGVVREPLDLVMSLLLAYAGFELIYAHINTSVLMTALLAVVNLGIALVGAHLATQADADEVVS